MKQTLWKHPKEVKPKEDMKKKWVSVQKKLQPDVVHNLMRGVKRKVRVYGYGIEVECYQYAKSLLMSYIL